jgi:hypothetical protein
MPVIIGRRELMAALGGMVAAWPLMARGAAARVDAAARRAEGVCRERPERTGLRRRIAEGTPKARVVGGPGWESR